MAAKADGMADANKIVTRVPMATPIEYPSASSTGQPSSKEPTPADMPDAAIPPTPKSETGADTQQSRRLPQSIFE
jgi:hypothetical protein